MDTFDVVIVGARCAGSPLAVMLARHGWNVCVVDKARFPSETPSTHIIQPCGVSILDGIGALEPALRAGAVPIDRVTLVNDDVRVDGHLDGAVFPQPGLCMRRLILDALLVDAASAAGVAVRTGVKMTGLLTRDGRVVGIETKDGPIRADLVIGADGRHSTVAANVQAHEYLSTAQGRTPAWAYYDGIAEQTGHLRIGRLGEHAYLACPTDSGLFMVCVASGDTGYVRGGVGAFDDAIAQWDELAELLSSARRTGPIRTMTRWHGYFRQSAGPGWVLLGDAGHFKDFALAQGISDALRQAQHLAHVLPSDLDDHRSVDAATHQWWRWRDDDAREMYWFAADMGRPGPPPPLVTEVLRDIAGDNDATRTLLKVLNHEHNPARLQTPRRLAVATARAIRRHPVAASKEVATTFADKIRRARFLHGGARQLNGAPGRSRPH
jgi:menaquinone-9 beta-reductase